MPAAESGQDPAGRRAEPTRSPRTLSRRSWRHSTALGGVEYLCAVAREDPKAFCALLGKLIPVKVAGDEENPLVLQGDHRRAHPKKLESSGLLEQRESAESTRAIVGPTTRAANERDND